MKTRARSILVLPRHDDIDRPHRHKERRHEDVRDTHESSDESDRRPPTRAHVWMRPGNQPANLALRQHHGLGNARVARLVARSPDTASMSDIGDRARAARSDPNATLAYAGVPLKQDPPGGMQFIANQSGPIGLGGKPAGYTAIKSAAAFTAPSFVTKMSAEKDGYKRRYFVEVQPTSATDVTHPSYYPAPGTHDNAVSEQKDGTYTYYWKISQKISELIRIGEQEHLNDAQRAFDLTYGLIAKTINAMVGERFGPAETPQAAEQLAEAELARRLPAALGTNQTTWFNVLEAMLDMTLKRDRQHLHDVVPGKAVERGKTLYIPLQTTDQTSIDQIGADQIVDYPAADGGNRTESEHSH
jgi:hypothetical protein